MNENKRTISIPADVMEETVKEARQMEQFSGMSDSEVVQAVLTAGTNRITENRLKTRAKRYDMMIRKDGHGGYMLVDSRTNTLAAPGPLTLEEVALWLDDLDSAQAQQ